MAEETKKNGSGAGKFFLGAALGAVVGAIAGKFISMKTDKDEDPDECDCKGKCEHCKVKNAKIDKLEKKVAAAKVANSRATDEKPKTEKKANQESE